MAVRRTSRTEQLIAEWEARASRAVTDTLEDFAGRLLEGFQSPKSGRYYGRHQASAPGEYPAIDLGDLSDSFFARRDSTTRVVLQIGGPSAPYAIVLEFGGVRMQARPYWSVTAIAVRPAFEARVAAIMAD